MSAENRVTLKGYFNTGDEPTELQFANMIDSFWHKSDDTLTVAWGNVSDKPTTFAPAAHTHLWAQITDKPSTFTPSAHTHLWADITDKPTTFAPAAHVHSAGEITTGLFHPSRIGAGTTIDGYMIQLVSGVPTWVVAPSGGGISGLVGNYLPKAATSTSLTNSQISDSGTAVGISSLAGSGTRMVVTDASGVLSATAIPSGGGGISGLTLNSIPIATSSTTIGNSALSDAGTSYRLIKPYFVIQDTNAGIQFWKDGAPSKAAQFGFNNLIANGLTAEVYDGTSWNIGWGITPNGNMGIKTAAPTSGYALDVNGDVAIGSAIGTRGATDLLLKRNGTTVATFKDLSIGLGNNCTIGGTNGDVVIGYNSIAVGQSVAVGRLCNASGDENVTLGSRTYSVGVFTSIAIGGYGTSANASYTVCIGKLASSAYAGAFVMHDNQPEASWSADRIGQFKTKYSGGYDMYVGTTSPLLALSVAPTTGYLKIATGTYPDEGAAIAAGLTTNTIYKTPAGELRIKL